MRVTKVRTGSGPRDGSDWTANSFERKVLVHENRAAELDGHWGKGLEVIRSAVLVRARLTKTESREQTTLSLVSTRGGNNP